MYLGHFGLRQLPFELTADPRFLFLTAAHREALANLEYGLSTAKAATLLIGEAGTGKTTLLRTALESEGCRRVRCVYLHNPALTRPEFVEMLSQKLDLGPEAGQSKTRLLIDLEAALRRRHEAGETVALVVDEAQSLNYDLLEEIRLLANIETPAVKLLPVVLAGQPEFAQRLNEPELRQLKQRIALRCALPPLKLNETASYIAHRIRAAAGDASKIFTREAVTLIHARAHGIPRTVSVICDNALVSAFAMGRPFVTQDIVLEVCRDFDLPGTDESAIEPLNAGQGSVPLVNGAGEGQSTPGPGVSTPERLPVLGLSR